MSLQVDACFAHVSAGLSLPSRSHGILVRRDEGRQGGQSLGVGGRGGGGVPPRQCGKGPAEQACVRECWTARGELTDQRGMQTAESYLVKKKRRRKLLLSFKHQVDSGPD